MAIKILDLRLCLQQWEEQLELCPETKTSEAKAKAMHWLFPKQWMHQFFWQSDWAASKVNPCIQQALKHTQVTNAFCVSTMLVISMAETITNGCMKKDHRGQEGRSGDKHQWTCSAFCDWLTWMPLGLLVLGLAHGQFSKPHGPAMPMSSALCNHTLLWLFEPIAWPNETSLGKLLLFFCLGMISQNHPTHMELANSSWAMN